MRYFLKRYLSINVKNCESSKRNHGTVAVSFPFFVEEGEEKLLADWWKKVCKKLSERKVKLESSWERRRRRDFSKVIRRRQGSRNVFLSFLFCFS